MPSQGEAEYPIESPSVLYLRSVLPLHDNTSGPLRRRTGPPRLLDCWEPARVGLEGEGQYCSPGS
jgi:hypothetical protein